MPPRKDTPAITRLQYLVNQVLQSYALFPHMAVLQNIASGLDVEKLAKVWWLDAPLALKVLRCNRDYTE